MTDRATEVALFRYALIREAADPALSTRQRGRLVRSLAEGTHVGPGASRCGWAGPRPTSGSGRGGPAGLPRIKRINKIKMVALFDEVHIAHAAAAA